MLDEFLYGYNWFGFIISFVLLGIIPVWVLTLFEINLIYKILLTVFLGMVIFIAVKTGGTKKSFIGSIRRR